MWWRDLLETLSTLRLSALCDIAIMSVLLYLVLLWFKRTKAAFVARGIFIFAMVYVLAQQSGMYLTTWAFQGFFAIFLIALVVIFQEELRSFFERLAVWSLRRRGPRAVHPPEEVEMLVRAAGEFAHKRIGALVVLRGQDPLERHLEGGEDLDGKLSAPLLDSLFDPNSEGHDGAVVVDHGRVLRFGAHLPLSKEFSKLSGLGTRHAAALGLSERTDVLCLVVSEENGTISVAQNGELSPIRELEALERRLLAFHRAQLPQQNKLWRDAWRKNAMEKVLAVLIALGLWLVFVKGFSPASAVFKVPVEVQGIGPDVRLTAVRPAMVSMKVRGLKRTLELLNPWNLRVTLNIEGAQAGIHRIALTESQFHIPGSVQWSTVDPSTVEVELTPLPAAHAGDTKKTLSLFGLDVIQQVDSKPALDAGQP